MMTMNNENKHCTLRINNAAYAAIQRMKAALIENGETYNAIEVASQLILKGAQTLIKNDSAKAELPTENAKRNCQKFDFKKNGFLTNQDIAKRYGIDKKKVCAAHIDGTLPYVKVGHTMYHTPEIADAWIKNEMYKKIEQFKKENDDD